MSGSVAQGIGIASLSSTSFRDGIIDHFDGFSLCISLYVGVCANSYFFLRTVCVCACSCMMLTYAGGALGTFISACCGCDRTGRL